MPIELLSARGQGKAEVLPNKHNKLNYFIAGGFGGTITIFLGFPFDTIKVKLQAMPIPVAGEAPLYNGTWDCAVKTVKKDGLRGLYRGMAITVAGVGPSIAVSFLTFSAGKQLANSAEDAVLTNLQLFGAGAFSGLATSVIMAPGERVKCLLQVQRDVRTPVTYSGPVDVVRKLYRQGGVRSLYKGTIATLLRDVPGNGLYFMTYEFLQRQFNRSDSNSTRALGTVVSGGTAGLMYWVVACPADVAKTRLQIAPEGVYPSGLRDVFRQLIREGGVAALYRGVVPVMARSFPANACCFSSFELAMHYLDKL